MQRQHIGQRQQRPHSLHLFEECCFWIVLLRNALDASVPRCLCWLFGIGWIIEKHGQLDATVAELRETGCAPVSGIQI